MSRQATAVPLKESLKKENGKQILLLIGSPKISGSSSESLGSYLVGKLLEKGFVAEKIHLLAHMRTNEKRKKILAEVNNADIIILSFPLYVDSLPSWVIGAFDLIAEDRRQTRPSKRQLFCAISNSGFPEASQNDTAIAISRKFAIETGFEWAGGFTIGMGGAIGGQPLEKGGSKVKNIRKAFEIAAASLAEGKEIPQEAIKLITRPMMPKWLYMFFGNLGMKREAKKHKVKDRINDRPYEL